MSTVTLLLFLVLARPMAPISYSACLTSNRAEADLVARQVSSIEDAGWCLHLVKVCDKADLAVYRNQAAHESFVISESCR